MKFRKAGGWAALLAAAALWGCSGEGALTEAAREQIESAGQQLQEAGEQIQNQIEPEYQQEAVAQEDLEQRYYYSLLDEESRQIYRELVQGMRDGEETIVTHGSDPEKVNEICSWVYMDYPEFFWFSGTVETTGYTGLSARCEVRPEYTCTPEERAARQQQIDASAGQCLAGIPADGSTYEKIRYLYTWLVEQTEYAADAPENQNIYSALINRRSVCAGYSRAMQYLLQKSGLTALYVPGKVKGRGYHAWNIVRCNGDFYHVDVTFGDPNFTNYSVINQKTCIPHELKYNYAYLCCNDEIIYRDRMADPYLYLPPCPKDNFNYFRMLGNYFTQYSAAVARKMEKSLFDGERCWQCQFSDKMSYEQMRHNLQNGLYANMILNCTHCSGRIQTHYLYQPEVYVVKMWY